MLWPLLQALWQKIGPSAMQAANAIAPYTKSIPKSVYIQGARVLSEELSKWHSSLEPASKERIKKAIDWAIEDLLGDLFSDATGLPVSELVKPVVGKVLNKLQGCEDSPEAKAYITSEVENRLLAVCEDSPEAKAYITSEVENRLLAVCSKGTTNHNLAVTIPITFPRLKT